MVYAIKPNPIKLPTNFPDVTAKSSSSRKPSPFQRTSLGRTPIKDPSTSNKFGLQRDGFARSPVRYPDSNGDPRKVPRITRDRYNNFGFKNEINKYIVSLYSYIGKEALFVYFMVCEKKIDI